MKLAWSHAFIPVKNVEDMCTFYQEVLGFKIADAVTHNGKQSIVFLSHLETEHHQIAFAQADNAFQSGQHGSHFAFRTTSLQEVKRLYLVLNTDHRIGPIKAVSHGNTWSLYFHDPEGNGLEIFCDTPWQVDQPFSIDWDPTASDAKIERQTYESVRMNPSFAPNIRAERVTSN